MSTTIKKKDDKDEYEYENGLCLEFEDDLCLSDFDDFKTDANESEDYKLFKEVKSMKTMNHVSCTDSDEGEHEVDYSDDFDDGDQDDDGNEAGYENDEESTPENTMNEPPMPLTPLPHSISLPPSPPISTSSNVGVNVNVNASKSNNTNSINNDFDMDVTIEKDTKSKPSFEYQEKLREYVNQCLFMRTNRVGKRIGFKPVLPKNNDFVQCWNCSDWIPPHISPPVLPLCSQTHMHSKYVYEKMIGFFCSFECCKKYIFDTMGARNRDKYMRSLLQFRRTFFPNLNAQPIQMVPPRTCTTLFGGTITPEHYYSKMVKINLPPLAEDSIFTLKDFKTSA